MTSLTIQPRRNWKKYIPRLIQYAVLTLIVIVVFVPIVMLVFSALKTRGEAMTNPYTLPIPPRWDNYINILSAPNFWMMLRNSLLVMAATTTGVVIVCSMAAFVFARMRFRSKDLLFNILTLGLMFPINIGILPVYLLIRDLHLPDTFLGVILVQTAFALSGNIMILRGFFLSIPMELEDASYIDGCTPFEFFWRILLPIAKPALAAVAALTMIVSWNDLLVPLVLINKETLWTLPLGTMQFQGQYGMDVSLVNAFVSLSALPTIIFYIFAERQIVAGMTAGAVKG
ncbi:MAG: thiamine ABC transporter ATP-binding protein [Chloroflexi bacterium RBG_13_60_9]|nr:MAG: thiamine ABC transporter ATP-binding protein [Chloroflexi bacterium RBG_13_60_9]